MIDIFLHFVCSIMLMILITGLTRKVGVAIATVLLLGLCKEIFLDMDISALDLAGNMAGILTIYSSLASSLLSKRYG